MKLYLYGHDQKYAVEQMLLSLYPDERPEYPEGKPSGDRVETRVKYGEKLVTASCKLVLGGVCYHGKSTVPAELLTDEVEKSRLLSRILKNAFYRAARRAGHTKPVWGALTGVRPGKLFCALLEQGLSPDKAAAEFCAQYDVSPERAELCRDASSVTMDVKGSLSDKDICLYIGIPFCPTRCSYCSFVSQSVEKSMKLIPPFLDALSLEIRATAQVVHKLGLRVISVYMGGGTPTTLSAQQLDRLCTELEESFDLSFVCEYTVEAGRPDTITEEKMRVLKAHGVDRVSVNPQTMSDEVLETIGRRHTSKDIVDALGRVRSVGGMAVNMDLIAGLPGDTPDGFSDTLSKVLALEPENITVHTLSLKKGSRITLEGSPLPTADEVGQMLDTAGSRLREGAYFPYYLYRQKFMSGGFENVGWTKDGYVNLYNVCIMEELCPIIALGGGGSTKLTARDGGRGIRLFAPKYPVEYISGIDKTCADKEKIAAYFDPKEENG